MVAPFSFIAKVSTLPNKYAKYLLKNVLKFINIFLTKF